MTADVKANSRLSGDKSRTTGTAADNLHDDRACRPSSKQQPGDRTHRRQHRALDEHLPRQLRPRRAKRDAHTQLAAPAGAARELQVGDVRTGHEQHHRHDTQQRHQRPLQPRAQARHAVADRRQREGCAQEIGPDISRIRGDPNLRLRGAQRLLGGLQGDAGAQTQHHREPRRRVLECNARRYGRLRFRREDHVEAATDVEAQKRPRRDADNRRRHAVDDDGRADDVGAAAEPLAPQPVTDHRADAGDAPARDIVGRGKEAADHRREAERGEEIAACKKPLDRPLLAAGGDRRLAAAMAEGQRGAEAVGVMADFIEDGVAHPTPRSTRCRSKPRRADRAARREAAAGGGC